MYTFEKISLSRDMYKDPDMTFSQILEKMDPSYKYSGTQYEETTAFDRQMIRYNINRRRSTICSFYDSEESAILFPEYVTLVLEKGMDFSTARLLSTCSGFYRFPALTSDSKKILSDTVDLSFPGTDLLMSVELSQFEKKLRNSGRYIGLAKEKNLIDTLCGNFCKYPITTFKLDSFDRRSGKIKSEFNLESIATLWSIFVDANFVNASLDCLLVPTTEFSKLASCLVTLQDKDLLVEFASNHILATPLGVNVIECPSLTNTMIGLNKSDCVNMYSGDRLYLDADKLIDKDFNDVYVTSKYRFAMSNAQNIVIYQK